MRGSVVDTLDKQILETERGRRRPPDLVIMERAGRRSVGPAFAAVAPSHGAPLELELDLFCVVPPLVFNAGLTNDQGRWVDGPAAPGNPNPVTAETVDAIVASEGSRIAADEQDAVDQRRIDIGEQAARS